MATPWPYRNFSAGGRAYWHLTEMLRDRGFAAETKPVQECRRYDPRTTIVIYPESIPGNPLNARFVVRWITYFPGFYFPMHPVPGEVQFTFQGCYAPELGPDRLLALEVMDADLFNRRGAARERTFDCAFLGKYLFYGNGTCAQRPEPPGLFEPEWIRVDHTFPPTRPALAWLLKGCRTLHTFDRFTTINYEALSCGCAVRFVPEDKPIVLADIERYTPAQIGAMVDNFAAVTQAM